jgi:hypothetical protein
MEGKLKQHMIIVYTKRYILNSDVSNSLSALKKMFGNIKLMRPPRGMDIEPKAVANPLYIGYYITLTILLNHQTMW